MAQWMQCNFIQTTPTWADAACNITTTTDTHDGFDSRKHDHDKRREAKDRLREMLDAQTLAPAITFRARLDLVVKNAEMVRDTTARLLAAAEKSLEAAKAALREVE